MAETEMVVRVAKAVRKAREMSLCGLCDMRRPYVRCSCEEIARAAIKAMRKPTDAMVAAMDELAGTINPTDTYQLAIDAAIRQQDAP